MGWIQTAFSTGPPNVRTADTPKRSMENNMKGYGWYFIVVGLFGIVMAFARAKNERELFLILATIPTAFLVVRGAEFLRNRKEK
jgi:succinate-acetate transporter protein